MKTRAVGTMAAPSNDSCGSNTSTPSAFRRSVTRTLARGSFVLSVKFSFRSIAGLGHAHDEIAPRVESFHGDLKLRRRGRQLEGVDRRRPHPHALGLHADAVRCHEVEVEGAVFAERIAGAHAIGDFAMERPVGLRMLAFDREAAGNARNGDAG